MPTDPTTPPECPRCHQAMTGHTDTIRPRWDCAKCLLTQPMSPPPAPRRDGEWVPISTLPDATVDVLVMNCRGDMRVRNIRSADEAKCVGAAYWTELPPPPIGFEPVKTSGKWRDAIGCSPVPPGTPPPEERIRALRGGEEVSDGK